jgi:hypothetical protein
MEEEKTRFFVCDVCGKVLMSSGIPKEHLNFKCCDEFMVETEEENIE